jgi:hypothetical protein
VGFEEERGDFFGGSGGDGRRKKRELLSAAVERGGILTGFWDSYEVPYDGAHFHASELEAEGMLKKHDVQPVADVTIWVAVTPGARGNLKA